MDGVELIRQLRDSGRLPAALILTISRMTRCCSVTLRAGANGYLLEDVNLLQLLAAIREIAGDGSYINPAVTDRALRAPATGSESPASDPSAWQGSLGTSPAPLDNESRGSGRKCALAAKRALRVEIPLPRSFSR